MIQSTVNKGIELTQTGIPGLDDMLGGGLPRGRVVSVFGGPGTGKTTFALQFLCNGFRLYDEPGIYVSLDESPKDVKRNMSAYGWEIEELEKKGKLLLLDASLFKRLSRVMKMAKYTQSETAKDYSLVTLSNLIKGTIEKVGAKRIVIDPVSTFVFQYPELNERRLAMMDLLSTLRSQEDCTSLIVMDLRSSALEREYELEEYLSQGTLILSTVSQPESGLTRVILIEKMRGVEHDTQPRPYAITKQGIQVFAKEKIYATGFQVH
jgi:KaiC/GvpD/RAD55 family RecA-like ATPase